MLRGMRVFRPVAGSIATLLVVSGCGAGLRDGARFDGKARPALAAAAQVEETNAVPRGFSSLGSVEAHCTLTEGARRLHGEWLSDVDCSVSRLVQAMKERAADVGGELLVGRVCTSQQLPPGLPASAPASTAARRRPAPTTTRWRAARLRAGVRPGPDAGRRRSLAHPRRVHTGAAHAQPRAARADPVREVGLFPAGHVRLR